MLDALQRRIKSRIQRWRFSPAISVRKDSNLATLGSKHGGWTFEPRPDLDGSTIVSCGLGEDASFDVEFAASHGAKVIVVDPTPRAMAHFAKIQERLGSPSSQAYVAGGNQPVEAYDLRRVGHGSLVLEPSALWVRKGTIKFFEPVNHAHVSHSIVNLQNNYAADTRYIEVPAITPEDLLRKYKLTEIPLMKLDIEGAEIAVIKHMLECSITPRQLLVEFDEMNFPSERSRNNVTVTDGLLRRAGYQCRYFDGQSNFLYVRA